MEAERELGIKYANSSINACCRNKKIELRHLAINGNIILITLNNIIMIIGKSRREELQYREISLDSSSSLKDFAQSRQKYYKKWILNEEVDDEESKSAIMGMLVETLLLEPETFDNKFHMSACAQAPTGLMLEFVEALYRFTKEATNEEGVVMRDFEDISRDAYAASGFKIKYEAVISKFNGSDAEIYYREILRVRTNNLIVATTMDVANAEKNVDNLRTNFVTKDIVNLQSDVNFEVINQLKIEDYLIGNLHFKSMIDRVIIDNVNKTIRPYDLKCTWAVENFYEGYYLYRKAYIQAFVYHVAIQHFRNQNFPGYSIQPIQFIVCDSMNYYNPLIYALTFEDLEEAKNGFEHKGKTYPGVMELVSALDWAQTNNIWHFSKANYKSNGIVNLKK